jgi:hypothetical protein
MRHWTPKFIENSKIPVVLSKIAPIEIHALSFGPFVWGRAGLNKTCRRHETIHFQQQLELLFLLQWLLYGVFWLAGLIKYRDGAKAYCQNPFEQEAYENQKKIKYLNRRKRWSWRNYKI